MHVEGEMGVCVYVERREMCGERVVCSCVSLWRNRK